MNLRLVGSLFASHKVESVLEMSQSERLDARREDLLAGSRIKTMEDLRPPRKYRAGTIRDIGFTTMEGFSYSALVGIPKVITSPVPLVETTAWFMGLDGYYRHEALSYMGTGNLVVIVGAEGSNRTCADHGGRLSGISLEKSAVAVLNFSGEVVDQYDELDKDSCLIKGASRGAMVGMGMQALAGLYDKRVLYADLTAPCFPRPFNPLHDTYGLIRFVMNEPQTLISLGFKMPLSLARRYHASIDLHPASLLHELAITSPLFSGEAGDLARLINPDTDPQMHITTFGRDLLSMHGDWMQIFANHQGVRVTPLKGSHLALADKQTSAFQRARNRAAQEQILAGNGVSSHVISEAAHEHISELNRIA